MNRDLKKNKHWPKTQSVSNSLKKRQRLEKLGSKQFRRRGRESWRRNRKRLKKRKPDISKTSSLNHPSHLLRRKKT
jgi:hypothetical protein